MAEGTRLRWWQEQETEAKPAWQSSAPPVVTAKIAAEIVGTRDVGEELEEEARQRALAEREGKRLEIYAAPAKMANLLRRVRRMRRFVLWFVNITLTLCQLMFLVGCLHAGGKAVSDIWPVWLLIFAEQIGINLFYNWIGRISEKNVAKSQEKPVLTLTEAGIEIQGGALEIGLLRWNEIQEIRAYKLIHRYVGIVPRDLDALCARLPKKQANLIRFDRWCARWMFRPFGKFTAPINIVEAAMPMSADALVARLAAFETAQEARRGNGAV